MARIEIQKTMFVDGKEVNVSDRAPVTDAAYLERAVCRLYASLRDP